MWGLGIMGIGSVYLGFRAQGLSKGSYMGF